MYMTKIAAFFDVDGTLLKENVSVTYIKTLFSEGRIGLGALLKTWFIKRLHKMNLLTVNRLSNLHFESLKGWTEKEAKKYSITYFKSDIKKKLFPEMIDIIKDHKKKGHIVVLITNSPGILIENIKKYVNADKRISSNLELKDGKYTGTFTNFCYGVKKFELFHEFVKGENIDLKKSYFYTDSFSDIKVIQSVGNPVAVNPDSKLKRYCQKNQIEIILI
jgi:putative phosphoserine phosphatase / 1-acylglycerol-3-phosphate O-acyltransferase